jgi:hypothetical protein
VRLDGCGTGVRVDWLAGVDDLWGGWWRPRRSATNPQWREGAYERAK